MCEACSDWDWFGFNSFDEFDAFKVELNEGLEKGVFKFIESQEDFHVYECQVCQKKWYFSEPDDRAWNGCFVKEEDLKFFERSRTNEDSFDQGLRFSSILYTAVLIILLFLAVKYCT